MLLKDNTARAKQIISIFWIMLGITIIDMASLAWQYILVSAAQNDLGSADMEAINVSDTLRQIVVVVNLIIFILAIIFFILWFRRAYYNLHELPWHNARYTEGWAAGSWFVPVINLWWPYQIMVDIWRGTQNTLRERLGEPQPVTIIGWWWALRLTSSFFSQIAARVTGDANGIDELITATKLEFFSDIMMIPAIIITIVMIQRTSNFEKELLIHAQTPDDSIFSDNYTPPAETPEPKLEN
jgi:hypothetical protein